MRGRRRGANLVDTDEMESFFDQLDHLNQEQLLSLRAAWYAASRGALEDAWTTVRAIGARDGLSKEIDRVRSRAMAWCTRGSDAFPYSLNVDLAWQRAKMEAGEAIVEAALAIALRSRLDATTHDLLIEPWLRATRDEN